MRPASLTAAGNLVTKSAHSNNSQVPSSYPSSTGTGSFGSNHKDRNSEALLHDTNQSSRKLNRRIDNEDSMQTPEDENDLVV